MNDTIIQALENGIKPLVGARGCVTEPPQIIGELRDRLQEPVLWTVAVHHLNRRKGNKFGFEAYAGLGNVFLMADLGVRDCGQDASRKLHCVMAESQEARQALHL